MSTTSLPSPPATLPPSPRPPVAPTPPRLSPTPSRPPPRRSTARELVAVGLAVVLVGAVLGVVLLTRGDGPPVRQLRVTEATAAAVTLGWTAPEGSTPDRYLVVRDGSEIGQTKTLGYTDRSVAPGTRYVYEVSALVDGAEGESARVRVRTALPPVSEALLRGEYRVRFVVAAAAGWESIRAGDTDTETWRITNGGSRLHGASLGGTWTMTLQREGAVATGSDTAQLSACQFVPVTDTVTVRMRVTAGRVIGGDWVATRFTGSFRDVAPAASVGLWSCPGSSLTAEITGTVT